MSYKFLPKTFNPTSISDPNIRNFEVGSGRSNLAPLVGGPFDFSDMKNFKDYKIKNGTEQYIKGFYRTGRYLKGKKIGWISTEQNGLENDQDHMKTCIHCIDNIQQANVFVGKIYVTYYVSFKNRKYA